MKYTRTIRGLAGAAAAAAVLSMASPAAANHIPKNCWGQVSAQRAVVEGGLGEHSSAQASPRMGLGNTARFFGFDHVSELGDFLASVDGIDETSCLD